MYLNYKRKLVNAKDKLNELQELVGRLQMMSNSASGSSLTSVPTTNKPVGQYDAADRKQTLNEEEGEYNDEEEKNEEEETVKFMEYLNVLEHKKKEEKLEELKRNKLKLLEILKQKEEELANLANMNLKSTSHASQNRTGRLSTSANNTQENLFQILDDETKIKLSNQSISELNNVYSSELESKFKSAENDFDVLSLDNLKNTQQPNFYLGGNSCFFTNSKIINRNDIYF